MADMKHKVLSYISSKIPYRLLDKLAISYPLVPYYHIVSDDDVVHLKYLYSYKTPQEFRGDIDFLLKHFEPIDLIELLNYVKNGSPLPKRSFLLTFDDGFREIHDIVAPILLEKGLSATFFLNSAFIDNKNLFYKHKASILVAYFEQNPQDKITGVIKDVLKKYTVKFTNLPDVLLSLELHQKAVIDEIAQFVGYDFDDYLSKNKPYLTTDQINHLLGQGFTIGAHSIDHPNYSLLNLQEQLFQTLTSVEHLKGRFHIDYAVFSFPHGDFNLPKIFFNSLNDSNKLDLTFGNCGFIRDECAMNIQRMNFEKPGLPADKILRYEFTKNIIKKMIGKDYIVRH